MKKLLIAILLLASIIVSPIKAYWAKNIEVEQKVYEVSVTIGDWLLILVIDENFDFSKTVERNAIFMYEGILYIATRDFMPTSMERMRTRVIWLQIYPFDIFIPFKKYN